jgi:hypothetical protein
MSSTKYTLVLIHAYCDVASTARCRDRLSRATEMTLG